MAIGQVVVDAHDSNHCIDAPLRHRCILPSFRHLAQWFSKGSREGAAGLEDVCNIVPADDSEVKDVLSQRSMLPPKMPRLPNCQVTLAGRLVK